MYIYMSTYRKPALCICMYIHIYIHMYKHMSTFRKPALCMCMCMSMYIHKYKYISKIGKPALCIYISNKIGKPALCMYISTNACQKLGSRLCVYVCICIPFVKSHIKIWEAGFMYIHKYKYMSKIGKPALCICMYMYSIC